MSGLAELERAGYRFRLDGARLLVEGPPELLQPDALTRLRQHKPVIRRELVLRDFIDLVRAAAACNHHVLLHREQIAALLDAADREALLRTTRTERQEWAELLAHRLAAPDASWVPALDKLQQAKR